MVGWRILLWVVLVLSAILFLYLVRGILLPFVVSFIIAALLEPTVRRLRLRGYSRGRSVGLVLAAFYLTFIAAGVLLVPPVARQVTNLTNKVQDLTREFSTVDANDNYFLRWNPVVQVQQNSTTSRIDGMFTKYGNYLERFGLPSTRRAFMEQYVEKQRPKIAKAFQSVFDSMFGILQNLFSQLLHVLIVFILVPMFLMDMENFKRRSPRWIPPAIRASTINVMSDIGEVFVKYLRGISTVVLLFTGAVTLLLLVLQVPYGFLLGALFGALYLIPYIGNIVSCAILLSLIGFSNVSGNFLFGFTNPWAYATLCTVLFLAIGFLFDHWLYPQMVGNSVGLSPVVSMFVILCGGALFGLPGMLIAFPLAGSVKVVLDRLIRVTSTSAEGLDLPSVPMRHRVVGS